MLQFTSQIVSFSFVYDKISRTHKYSLLYFSKSASLEAVTGPFGDKTDVVAKHWKTHVAEERSDIVSELACMGLAHLEEWHYSAFDSSGTCSLGLISTESIPNPTGKDTK